MEFIKVPTRTFLPPRDDLYELLDVHLPRLKNGDIVFITSKVLAIHQGRCVLVKEADKKALIKKEADARIKSAKDAPFELTIKDYTLIPSAGIDESNGNGYYILWPRNTVALVKEIRARLMKKFKLTRLAVVATDSHTIPLRYGVLGISTGFYGMEPLHDYRGKKDIFGRPLQYTRTNIVDALAVMAVMLMGEGKEKTPIVIGRNIPGVKFTNKPTYKKLVIPTKKDLYYAILKNFKKHG
nr:F420-0:Gamma-glutamyl ligase [uncultured bacterium]